MAITPKPAVTTEPVNIRFPQELLELLDDYCRFLGGATDRSYVILEALRQTIHRDRRYSRAREARQGASSPARTTSTPSGS